MKKTIIAVCMLLIITGCSKRYEKYSAEFYDVFDTVTIVTAYEKNRGDFDRQVSVIYNEMERLHKLYDIYNDYEGINNAKTINDNAGISPVRVDEDLIDLISFGIKAYGDTSGSVNIALGSVLKTWHKYRQNALEAPGSAAIPSADELRSAAAHTGINDVIIDRQKGTVYLKDPEMSLDLGALAKGYAVGLAGKKAQENGLESVLINAGGNIYAIGAPNGGRRKWNVGIVNPFAETGGKKLFDTLKISGGAVVSSGDYQRFYIADGTAYHHIIDPETLMPANKFRGVTIAHPESGIADMLSTAVFILPFEDGKRLVEELGGEAVWIYEDNSFKTTDGYKKISGLF